MSNLSVNIIKATDFVQEEEIATIFTQQSAYNDVKELSDAVRRFYLTDYL